MKALTSMPISFPGLFGDWSWNPDPVALHIGHGVYWYGIILAIAMLCGMYLSMRQAERFGLTEDHVSDLALCAVPCCIIGSRTYYVLFNQSLYRTASGALDWKKAVAVWDGGIAIYGTVIAGFLVAFVFSRVKKIPMGALADACVPGLMLGQVIGRWANLINREAFGGPTDLPWRMRLWISPAQSVDVHPTFLYESLWNLAGLLLILFVVARWRRFDGEVSWFYFLWYGAGRFWIEALRTDSLYLFGWTFLGEPVRVSQLLSAVMSALAACVLFWELHVKKRTSDGLYVNRAASPPDTAPEPEPVGTAEDQPDRIETAEPETENAEPETELSETGTDTENTEI